MGVSYHRNPEHGGSYGSSSQQATGQQTQGSVSRCIVPSRSERRHREMVSRAVLLTLAGDRGLEVVAAAALLDGAVNGLERRAYVAGPLRCEPRGAALVVSQVAFGQNLHRLVRGAAEVAH